MVAQARKNAKSLSILFTISLSAFPAFGQPGPPGPPILTRSPEAGLPRPWEAGVQVSPYSTVNLYNGNLATVIPIVAYAPVGPAVRFTLYHNAASAAGGAPAASPTGFTLGPGWSVSYGGSVVDNGDGTVTLTEDDGNQWTYTWNGSSYDPEPGKHDDLLWNATQTQWEVTRRDQTKLVFDEFAPGVGWLIAVHGSAGNVLHLERDTAQNNYRIKWIASAAETNGSVTPHRLEFNYLNDRLNTVVDPIGRTWTFVYDGSDRLWKLKHPYDTGSEPITEFGYDVADRINAVISRDSQQWDYTYNSGRLDTVTDPAAYGGAPHHTQNFWFSATKVNNLWRTDYTDRRAFVWKYGFASSGALRERTDPLLKLRAWTYDSDRNPITFTNELSKTWTYTYGPVANVETISTPIIGQTWDPEWIAPGTGEPWNFYRLLKSNDPGGHWVQYAYADATDPTLVTTVTEQEAQPGGGTAVTTLEYYDATSARARGQLKLVTDHNGVKHKYEYDPWGYFEKLSEGLLIPLASNEYPMVIGRMTNDGAGRTTGGTGDSGATGSTSHDPDDNPTDDDCDAVIAAHPLPVRLGDVPSPHLEVLLQCSTGNLYDIAARPTNIYRCIGDMTRNYEFQYDNLGRLTQLTTKTNDAWVSDLQRVFQYTLLDPDGRVLDRQGPDAQTTTNTYDELGRPKTVSRSGMGVHSFYDAAGRLERIEYDSGAEMIRQYDDAGRLEQIKYEDALNQVIYQLDYVWTLDNLIQTRTETDSTGLGTAVFTVTFGYDNRHRLTSEVRDNLGSPVYAITYTYDQLGNRLTKTDSVSGGHTNYFYDAVMGNRDPLFQTNNNRLLWYEEYDATTLVRTVRYTYWKTGHVSNITIKDEYQGVADPADFDWYYDLALYYASNGTLWRARRDKWKVDANDEFTDYTAEQAWEFLYDEPRARFLAREVTTDGWWAPIDPQDWTDYDGVQPYGDFEVDVVGSHPVVAEQLRYLAGFGVHAQQTVGAGTITYLHGDLIRSSMLTTDANGDPAATLSYTAFGETIGDPSTLGTRYQYAGGWGYESDLLTLAGAPGTMSITLQHIGARWYQPSIGRFVQRDPIGIDGGSNVYLYGQNNPVLLVDPEGEWILVLIGVIVVVYGGYEAALYFSALLENPRPEPTANPFSGKDPRNNGLMGDIAPLMKMCIELKGTFSGGFPPGMGKGVKSPGPLSPPGVPLPKGYRPPSTWNQTR